MPATQTDRLYGMTTSVAVKPPCRVATTGPITASGEQTINSVAVVTGDRVLRKDEVDTTLNGIWVVDTSAWSRAPDFDGSLDAVNGTLVLVQNAADPASFYELVATNPVYIGTSALTFIEQNVAFMPSVFGALLATSADDDAARLLLETPSKSELQTQTWTAFPSTGAAPAYALTPTPTITSYVAGQRFRVAAHASGTTGSNTLNVALLGPKNLKQYDSSGAKVNGVVASGQLMDVEYDGADMVILNPLTPTAVSVPPVPVRQTVLSGPVDTNGLSAFGGSTGATTVTASGTLIATAANGFSSSGSTDRIGSIVNPSWTGLSTNGTMYLYLDIAANGTCTTGSSTLAPTYRWGGADVVTNNQFTFNIQEMVGKVGNASVATQTYRVFVGEVAVAGALVTAITWYALMGRATYRLGSALAVSTAYNFNHNIGSNLVNVHAWYENLNTEGGYAVGDRLTMPGTGDGDGSGGYGGGMFNWTAKTLGMVMGAFTAPKYPNKSTGAVVSMTVANWTYGAFISRGW